MAIAAELLFDEARQFAFLATPAVVRAFIPAGWAGVYMLLRFHVPFYVGRSDYCIQTRLASHRMLPTATHVAWEPCTSPMHAYRLESAWFHAMRFSAELMNQIHPARPAGEAMKCPFCSTGDCLAWTHAMRPRKAKGAVSQVAVDRKAAAAETQGT